MKSNCSSSTNEKGSSLLVCFCFWVIVAAHYLVKLNRINVCDCRSAFHYFLYNYLNGSDTSKLHMQKDNQDNLAAVYLKKKNVLSHFQQLEEKKTISRAICIEKVVAKRHR